MSMNHIISYNGTLYDENSCAMSAFSRAVHYGDGVFETMRARGNRVFRLDDHLNRLCSGLGIVRIPLPAVGRLTSAVLEVLRANALPEAILKIIAFRSGPPGPTPAAPHAPCVLITVDRLDRDALSRNAAGVSARIVAIHRNTTSPLCGIKSLNYLDNIIARMEAAITVPWKRCFSTSMAAWLKAQPAISLLLSMAPCARRQSVQERCPA